MAMRRGFRAAAVVAAFLLVGMTARPGLALEAITGDGGSGGGAAMSGSTGGGAGGDTDSRLAQAAQRYKHAVGLVAGVLAPNKPPVGIGTAWAVRPNVFVTNAHVVAPVRKILKHGGSAFIAINEQPTTKLRIVAAKAHPKYGARALNYEGKPSVPFAFDVGLLQTDGSAPATFQIASPQEVQGMRSGYRVAYLGFPMERLIGQNVNMYDPLATMQSGIVTSVSDYWFGDSGPQRNLLIRHNLGATGGASGSPIFNANGKVVAVLNGGNISVALDVSANKVKPVRTPNAAMINFAQRADIIRDLLQ